MLSIYVAEGAGVSLMEMYKVVRLFVPELDFADWKEM